MFDLLDELASRFEGGELPPESNTAAPDATPKLMCGAADEAGDRGRDDSVDLVDEIEELERAKAMIEGRVMQLIAALSDRADGWVDPGDTRPGERLSPGCLAAAELAPMLHLAPVTAGLRVERALRMRGLLPLTLQALSAGHLDLGRVLAIDDATRLLDPEAVGRVERMVLPRR